MEKIDLLTTKFSEQTLTEVCLVEELAELTQAVQHVLRGRPHNLAEEMAHVTIMIEALRKKHGITPAEIMLYEKDMVDRYLKPEPWDGSHVPSTVHTNELVEDEPEPCEITPDGKKHWFM